MTNSGSRLTAILGPTNTGKTFLAMERMLSHWSGMIGFPLRLLARENYDRAVREKGKGAVALITGEEKIVPPYARYFICTVESMPLERSVAFVGVDEVQLAADPERGHIFTDRILRARGTAETMFMGSDSITKWLRQLVSGIEFVQRPRLSTLRYAGVRKLTRLPPRSAIVAFSAADVYAIAEMIRRERGGTAIVMGALSPRTRNAQVELYQAGEVDYLVATDAIGMGLNMDVHHVWFASLRKFDGWVPRNLTKAEISQIAGRAGRYMNDGTFGTTADVGAMDPEIVEAVENHRVEPLTHLMWRTARLDFRSLPRLLQSLEERPPHPGLIRQQEGEDHEALRHLARDQEIVALTQTPERVELLWEVCQIPDFRKLMTDAHVRLLRQVYMFLIKGRLPNDWVAEQFERLDRTDGDIDHLTQRISHIRTWAYVANRNDWLHDIAEWQVRAQVIEDRLSEALHEALTQRFVDRRRAALHRRMTSGDDLTAVVTASNEVLVEGHVVGILLGFRFIPTGHANSQEMRSLMAAARRALGPVLTARVGELTGDEDRRFRLSADSEIRWRDAVVAVLRAGDTALNPRIELLVDDILTGTQRNDLERRLRSWLTTIINRRLKPLYDLTQAELTSPARGLAYQVIERLGALPRQEAHEQIALLTKNDRRKLHQVGLRIGRETIWLPALNARASRQLLVQLHLLRSGEAPIPVLPENEFQKVEASHSEALLLAAGYRRVSDFAISFERLEAISARLQRLSSGKAVKWDAALAAALQVPEDVIKPMLRSLGFVAHGQPQAQEFRRRRVRGRTTTEAARPDSPFSVLADLKRPK